jgi:mannan endo-1,4-beta-mannosidase
MRSGSTARCALHEAKQVKIRLQLIANLFLATAFGVTGCAGEIAGENPQDELSSQDETTILTQDAPDESDAAAAPVSEASATTHVEDKVKPEPSIPTDPTEPSASGKVERPSYNQGTGFFVRDGKLYDANGSEFRVRGVNKLHWDMASPGLTKANSPVARWTIDFKLDPSKNLALLQGAEGHGGTIAEDTVIIPGNWDGTCKDDPKLLEQIVDTWIAQADTWKQLEKHMILNIANEWGPGDGEVWRDAYIAAIGKLRAAGYHATISVTAGGCGQDPGAIVKYGQAVFDADPEKNVIFDQHIYGEYQDVAGGAVGKFDDQPDLAKHVQELAATGLVVVLGEFGPGRDIGPSPTQIDPLRVIELAEQNNVGWLAWAWDDNNLADGVSDDKGFGMSTQGRYEQSSDLTEFGRVVVEHPTWGLKKLGKKASIFE